MISRLPAVAKPRLFHAGVRSNANLAALHVRALAEALGASPIRAQLMASGLANTLERFAHIKPVHSATAMPAAHKLELEEIGLGFLQGTGHQNLAFTFGANVLHATRPETPAKFRTKFADLVGYWTNGQPGPKATFERVLRSP